MTVAEATLEGYAQFPNSDCRNGGIVRWKTVIDCSIRFPLITI